MIWIKCIPLGMRSKTRRRATPLLPSWIYLCRSGGTVCSALPFTINVTISTSISQTFRSWVPIFHLRQPMAFYLIDHMVCQGLLLLWMFYSEGCATFIFKLLEQGYVRKRFKSFLRNVYGRYGDFIKHYEVSLSPNVTWHSGIYTVTPSIDQIFN